MIPSYLLPVANHLWQSTLFAAAAALLTLAFRNHRAPVRYGLWLAASLKFLVPFSLLVWMGSHLEWRGNSAAKSKGAELPCLCNRSGSHSMLRCRLRNAQRQRIRRESARLLSCLPFGWAACWRASFRGSTGGGVCGRP